MRVNYINSFSVSNKNRPSISKIAVHNPQKFSTNIVQISFAGKNINQIASLTPENNGLGLAETSQGGEGVVAFEAPESLIKHESKDVRSFMPFWEHNNPKGGYKFLIHKGQLKDTMPDKLFYSANVGEDIESVARKLNLKISDLSYVIQSKPNGTGPEAESKYCILEPTSIQGKIERPSSARFGEIEEIPYTLFKISENNPAYNKLKNGKNYFIYTPDLARASKPYAYDTWGNVPFEAEIVNSDAQRALAEVITSRMNTAEFDYYNPASVWAHDRPSATFLNHISSMSARGNQDVIGLKIHSTAHNTGRNYQGITDNPFKMTAIVGDSADIKELSQLREFPILKKASKLGINSSSLSPRERELAHTILDPYLAPFRDGAGTYNITKIPIAGVKTNPQNISVGTVSYTFDKEMKSDLTPDAAKFLTGDYAEIETKSVLNGSTPANLRLEDPNADFGRGNNGLSKQKSGFTTFKYDGNNIEEIISAREKNAKWLSGLIEKAGKKGQESLNKLFFNEGQIRDGHNVMGYISEIKDGDILIMGWGRPDEQKGFPITFDGFVKFLKRDDIPREVKQKIKLIVGAGPWDKNASDYKSIKNALDEISKIDGGIYAHNAMYVDGFFPNRLVGCAHFGVFTSRREMCGITPLEAKAAGVPYAATKTGGPVDYTNENNGYLTKEAVEGPPERYGLSWSNSADEIDAARVKRQADQMSDVYKQMYDEYSQNYDSYVSKCKKNIEELIDWHNNSEYNLGKSANQRYINDIWEIDKGWDERSRKPMKKLTGKFGEVQHKIEKEIIKTKSKPVKIALMVAAGTVAIAGGVYIFIKRKNTNSQKQINITA